MALWLAPSGLRQICPSMCSMRKTNYRESEDKPTSDDPIIGLSRS